MSETRNIVTTRLSETTEFEVQRVDYTDPETGNHYTLETKIGWIEAPDGYFIGKQPFERPELAYDYATQYGAGKSRVMRQLVGNSTYYCYMHFFKFEEAAGYYASLNVEKWYQKQLSDQRKNDKMLDIISMDELIEEGNDYATESDPTASVGITAAMRTELDKKLKARKKNLDKYDRLQQEGYNAREISEKFGANEWTVRDDLKRIKEVKKQYYTEE